jgi:hypothetical protein
MGRVAPVIYPGDSEILVDDGVPYSASYFMEVQAAAPGSEFATVYDAGLPANGALIRVPLSNEILYCVRARLYGPEGRSGWSGPTCVTPRVDPEPPSFELSAQEACYEASMAVVEINARDGDPHLLELLFGDDRRSVDPTAVVSGVAEMRLVVSETTFEEAEWTFFNSAVEVPFTEEVEQWIGVQLRDGAGNESEPRFVRLRRCE